MTLVSPQARAREQDRRPAGLPGGDNTLVFNLSSLGTLTGTTEFRVYVYNAPSAGNTFMDVRSSAADSLSNGLILNGPAAPEPSSRLLVLTGFCAALGLWKWRRRRYTSVLI